MWTFGTVEIVLFSSLIGLFCSGVRGSAPKYCGLLEDGGFDDRIVNGEEATPHMYPWVAKVLYEQRLHCGGSLIADKWVLSAGHCVMEHIKGTSLKPKYYRGNTMNYRMLPMSRFTVELGSHRLYERPDQVTLRNVDQIIIHPDFDLFASHEIMMHTNDLALLKIPTVEFNRKITTICLPKQGDRVKDNTRITLAGWGSTLTETVALPETRLPHVLKKTTLVKIPWEDCRKNKFVGMHLAQQNGMTDREIFCLIGNNTDGCRGDSGGPAFHLTPKGYFIGGIISWGIGCNMENYPSAYTQVASYVDFIRSKTHDARYLPVMP